MICAVVGLTVSSAYTKMAGSVDVSDCGFEVRERNDKPEVTTREEQRRSPSANLGE